MYMKLFMGIFGLAVSLMFISGIMAQEKSPATAAFAAQEMKVEKSHGALENVNKDLVVDSHEDRLGLSDGDKTKLSEDRNDLKPSERTKRLWAVLIFKLRGMFSV